MPGHPFGFTPAALNIPIVATTHIQKTTGVWEHNPLRTHLCKHTCKQGLQAGQI